ncbi:signal peptide peptidase SppA [Candidatus Peregrinibacteria bacterium]|nr:signal peptide peptidase SppA [Candidatus Peregrinibacteria bacterium]
MDESQKAFSQSLESSRDGKVRIILEKTLSEKIFSGIWTGVKILFFLGLFSSLFTAAEYEKGDQNLKKTYFDAYFSEEEKNPDAEEIAVIPLNGEIVDVPTDTYSSTYEIITDDVIFLLNKALNDEDVSAILLRIDTPGGTALAADKIARMIQKVEKSKPVFALLEGSATSGGYYIASVCTKIYAHPATFTGNIGVIISLPQIKNLSEKIGVNMKYLTTGKFKDMGNPFRDITEEEEGIFQELLQETYNDFVGIVAEGRKMKFEDVKKLADGRIYSGLQAKENGLVDDTVLSFAEALEKIQKETAISNIQPVLYEIPLSPFEEFLMKIKSFAPIQSISSILGSNVMRPGTRAMLK